MWLHPHCMINKVLLIEHLSMIPWFFELRDVVSDFFHSRWASLLRLNLVVVTELSRLQFSKLQTQRVSQSVWKKKFLPFDQMAGVRTCCSLYHNSPPGGEDELARGPLGAPIKDSNTPTLSLSIFWAQTSAPAPPLAPASSSTKELCQQLLKTYAATVKVLEQNHRPGPRK